MPTPKKNTAYTLDVSLFARSTGQIKTTPTLAAGDVKVTGANGTADLAAIANIGTLPAEAPAGSGLVKILLTAGEMNFDRVVVRFIDPDAEWHDLMIELVTTTLTIDDTLQADVAKWSGTTIPAVHTAGYPIVTIKDGTGTGEIDTLSGAIVQVNTLTTYTGNTLQTGNVATLITTVGTAGAGLTDLGGMSTTMKAQVETEAGDALASHHVVLVKTTIATLASQTSFTLTAGSADNSAYVGCEVVIEDVATAAQKAVAVCSAYTGATKTVTLLNDPAIFTMAATDIVTIRPSRALKATVDNRTLDVSTGGEAGIDWANIGTPGATVSLSATTVTTSIAAGGITTASFAAGAINAAAIAADAIGASELAADAALEIADAILGRSVATAESTASEHSLCTIILATLESAVSGTDWTIKRTDGSTTHFVKTLTVTSGVSPITAVA